MTSSSKTLDYELNKNSLNMKKTKQKTKQNTMSTDVKLDCSDVKLDLIWLQRI